MKFDVERALSHQIVLIAGDEEFLRRRALDALISAAAGDDDFDLESLSGDSSNPAYWLGSCGTAPFLSPKRVAVVRHLLRSEADEELGKPNLPDTALLILVADAEGGDDSKQKTLAARLKRWEKAVQAAKGHIYHASVDTSAFNELVKQELAKHGFKISPEAATALQEMVGGNLSAGLEELDKVMVFAGNPGTIQPSDVRAVVVPSREWNVFKLIDAVFGGDGGDALRQLRTMVGTNPKVEGPALQNALPMLSRQLRLVWQARLFVEAKASLTSPPESIRRLLPANPNLLAQKDFPQRIAMRTAQRVRLDQLAACFQLISDAEASLKGLTPSFTPIDTLEQMVMEMMEAVRPAKP